MFTILEVLEAYLDCRKNKRNKPTSIDFETNLGENLAKITRELNDGSYTIGVTTCFVITWPKFREVWAAQFRDRIVHHIIINRISAQFQNQFIYDSYACIEGRGSLFGANRVHRFMRQATENWQKPAHFLQADIANFFVSIDKNVLSEIILPRIECETTRALTSQIIWHDPTTNHIKTSPERLFRKVPKHKSLFNSGNARGLPIGNLSSQFFANVYMNELDQLVKRELKIKWYGRYVDDVVLISHDPKELNQAFDVMQHFARDNLKLGFHPNKTNRNTCGKGMDFCGYILLPHRKYVRQRTIKAMRKVSSHNDKSLDYNRWVGRMNSYLGICSHANSYNERKKLAIMTGVKFAPNLNKIITPRVHNAAR